MVKRIHVVAAVIRGADNRVLIAKRPAHLHMGGLWEFPGGKVHTGGRHEEALRRELFEELDIVGRVGALVHTVTHAYPEKTVELFFYGCDFEGTPKPMMGQEMRWVPRAELRALPFPDADRALIDLLVSSLP